MATPRQLRRSATSRVLGGVCGGLAEYFGIDPTIVRIILIALAILSLGFGGVILYILAWIIMPAPLGTGVETGFTDTGTKTGLGIVLVGAGLILVLFMAIPWGCGFPGFWHWSGHFPLMPLRFLLPVALIIVGIALLFIGLSGRTVQDKTTSTSDEKPEEELNTESTGTEKRTVRRLHRSLRNKKIAGICGGLGDYFNIDPTIFRLLWIFLLLFYGTGILIYLILWIVIPQEPVIISPPNSTT